LEIELPDLYTGHTEDDPDKIRKPLIMKFMEALKDGGGTEIGDTEFKINLKKAQIVKHLGDAMIDMTLNRHLDARAKAHIPLFGGNLDLEANRDAEGKHRFGVQFGKQF
jgi:hypothetical protein